MAKASIEVIQLLRATSKALTAANDYQWGHMGSCNCGFLAQQISKLRKKDIHQLAMQRIGDWSEQLNDYCPTSGYHMDDLITAMIGAGFDTDDLKHLERLSDARILKRIPADSRNLRHNFKSDVVKYLNAWADCLEVQLTEHVSLQVLMQESGMEIAPL